ncbi:hypothetical protein LOTGIDRAFT_134585 [Lottia gigantea]|uniref:Hexosyltransferase n=1 Tax=Lottia gigantea TaxID=225164 RepID=V3ZJ75_LOTGI|nr:hypothetical protein LOTGIDRAFT_134585 [Lottia gigantea]ESO82390.1 hypothetical protein LOTGIDRAFT_134585 [Lottia gigantea]
MPFLVILVLSVHHRTEERRVIRETWGRVAHGQSWPGKTIPEKIKIVFLFGLPQVQIKYNTELVKRESEVHRDIVMFEFSETYFNLTLKVLMGFKWIKELCPTTQFVMKADEDIFVDVPQLVARLHTPEWTNKISGLLFTIDKTHRKGKYRVSESLYPFQYYPPHVKGNIYVMPTDIAMKLLNISEYMPYLNMEDVHITGILAIAAKVNKYQRLLNEEFSPMGLIRSCDFSRRNMIAAAFIRPQQARDIWTSIVNPKICNPG